MNIHQWNAGGLSNPKMTGIKKNVNEENIYVLIIKEANVTKKNIKFYNMTKCKWDFGCSKNHSYNKILYD
jgi:hypothetical protein